MSWNRSWMRPTIQLLLQCLYHPIHRHPLVQHYPHEVLHFKNVPQFISDPPESVAFSFLSFLWCILNRTLRNYSSYEKFSKVLQRHLYLHAGRSIFMHVVYPENFLSWRVSFLFLIVIYPKMLLILYLYFQHTNT